MTHLSKIILIISALALSACTTPDRFDNAGGTGGTAAPVGPVAGSAQDPKSPLYFQQAIGDRVLFEVDQATLTTNSRGVLDGQASWLTTNSDYNAVIEGHADEQGTRQYNLALGARRANAVREYLASRGIDGGRLKVLSYGKERPIEVCSEEACYSKNRRSVTVLQSGLAS